MSEEQQYINYGSFESWAGEIDKHNSTLINKLHDIQTTIKNLAGIYESNAAETIRNKIQGMEPRFEEYYNVVENYAKLVRNTGYDFEGTEQKITSNAEQFI